MCQPYSAQLIVEAELHGVRIDSFLARHFRNYTSWRMQRLISAGQVFINEALAAPTQRVFVGEQVRIRLTVPPDKLLEPEPVAFRLIYEDPWLLVVDKPPGIVAHPTGVFQSGTLANGLQAYLDEQTSVRGLIRPGLPHRLDRQTSGLMVVAKHHRSHAGLSTAFETGRVSKSYVAIVEGTVARDEGTIDLPIGRARADRRVLMSARADAIRARPAKTHFHVEERFPDYTLVRAKPLTGRNHQIRVHLAHIGHPLLEDEFYDKRGTYKPWRTGTGGGAQEPGKQSADVRATATEPLAMPFNGLAPGRHALHAATLSFAHPITDLWLSFESALPADMRRTVESLRRGHRAADAGPSNPPSPVAKPPVSR